MSTKRYCPMCDEWMRQAECPKCGMPTDKALPEEPRRWFCEHKHECGWIFDFAAKCVYCRQCEEEKR